MRYTYGVIEKLEAVADIIVDLNKDLVKKVPNKGINFPPYLISNVPASDLKLPNSWEVREKNSIVNIYNLFKIEVIYSNADKSN